MIHSLLATQAWQCAETGQGLLVPELSVVQSNVLLVTSSLTQYLATQYDLKLDVQLHEQLLGDVYQVESGLLRVASSDRCVRRKVSLLSCNEVMYDAESVLPLGVLPEALMQELAEGRRPLASLLSKGGLSLSRSDLGITLVDEVGKYQHKWARRSVLRAESGATALVTEVFYDAIWKRLDG